MAGKALGLIETLGLVAAFEAADAALKAADVSLIGFEFPGHGGTTVKIEGEVAAVKFAVEAGAAAAKKVCRVFSWHVIPRPHGEVDDLVKVKAPKRILMAKTPAKKPSPKKTTGKGGEQRTTSSGKA